MSFDLYGLGDTDNTNTAGDNHQSQLLKSLGVDPLANYKAAVGGINNNNPYQPPDLSQIGDWSNIQKSQAAYTNSLDSIVDGLSKGTAIDPSTHGWNERFGFEKGDFLWDDPESGAYDTGGMAGVWDTVGKGLNIAQGLYGIWGSEQLRKRGNEAIKLGREQWDSKKAFAMSAYNERRDNQIANSGSTNMKDLNT